MGLNMPISKAQLNILMHNQCESALQIEYKALFPLFISNVCFGFSWRIFYSMNPNHFYFFHKTIISMCVCHTSSLVSLNENARAFSVCYQSTENEEIWFVLPQEEHFVNKKITNNKSNVPMFIESFLPSFRIGLCALFTGK